MVRNENDLEPTFEELLEEMKLEHLDLLSDDLIEELGFDG